jgi:hypothetical protein
MGHLTDEKVKEMTKKYYEKYYNTYYPKYGKIIDYYIKKFYPKKNNVIKSDSSMKSYKTKSSSVNRSLSKLANHSLNKVLKGDDEISKMSKSRDFNYFLYDLIYRRVLLYELRDLIYLHINNEGDLIKCLKNPDDYKKLKYISSGEYGSVYKLNDNICIKFVNITHTLNNLKYINFLNEIEMSKRAGEINVGPKIHDTYVCVNDEDSSCYGIIYMEYVNGMTLNDYLHTFKRNNQKEHVRKLLENKIFKLNNIGIMHNDLHADNVILLLDEDNNVTDLRIIDYGFAQYIKDYVYFRNHQQLNRNLFHFTRDYIYNTLTNLIVTKLKIK